MGLDRVDAADEPVADPGRVSWTARIVFSLVAVLAFVLGIVGFHQYLPAHPEYGRGFPDLVYYSLQLFVLDASPLQTPQNLPVTLQIARFAAPAVTAYLILLAAHALMIQRLVQARIRLMRGHSIVCGPQHLTRPLAEQIRRETGKVVVVGEYGRPRLRSLHVIGDPRNSEVLSRAGLSRAGELITVGPDSIRNAETAIAVHKRGAAVTCYAEAQDAELFHAVVRQDAGPRGVSRLESFDRHGRTARLVLRQFGPDDPRSAALVIGYDGLGRVLIDRLVRFWSSESTPPGQGPSLRVLDPDVPADVVERRHADPNGWVAVSALRYDPSWLTTVDELKVPRPGGTARVPGRVYVCLEDDAAGIALGEAILRLLSGHDTTVVVAVARSNVLGKSAATPDTPAARVLGRASLALVSATGAAYTVSTIRLGANEGLAKEIHQTYVREAMERGETAETNSSVRPWAELPEFLKDSNREQAADIGHKLAMFGFSAVPANGSARKVTFSAADVEVLAEIEHRRWMTERGAKGWQYGPVRDHENKLHPDMVAWASLPEESREKDRSAVRAIPDYLAAAGLTMIRTTA